MVIMKQVVDLAYWNIMMIMKQVVDLAYWMKQVVDLAYWMKQVVGLAFQNSELYYTRIKILGSCLFLQSVPANLHARRLHIKQ